MYFYAFIFYFIFFVYFIQFWFPGTFNFVGEFLIILGGFAFSNVLIFFSNIGIFLSLLYSLFLYNRIFFGSINILFLRHFSDITRLEFILLLVFLIIILIFGFYPEPLFNLSYINIMRKFILIF